MSVVEKKRAMSDYFRYQMLRLVRIRANPHQIALGVAFGVYISFTPLLGFHLILATLLCLPFGASKVASWIGTIIGNPLTFPIFFWVDYHIGSWVMGREGDLDLSFFSGDKFNLDLLLENFSNLFWPILLGGGLFLGPLVAAICYYLTLSSVNLRRRRRRRRMKKARNQALSWRRGRPTLPGKSKENRG
ncbi:DUF2062 domain-containing protein [Magnetococcales bacterium HHB-1]